MEPVVGSRAGSIVGVCTQIGAAGAGRSLARAFIKTELAMCERSTH